jgi:hypothetical protein
VTSAVPAAAAPASNARPPLWLVVATGLLTAACLAMAVAETSLWMHYLIDAGESISLAGLAFIAAAGVYLFTRRQLSASLALTLPWLLFPVITQGDQIIDNLSINWMRLIVHVLLGLIFGMPVAIAVIGARWALTPRAGRPPAEPPSWLAVVLPGARQFAAGRVREGGAVLAAFLLTLETWVAVQFLGTLMVITLILMIWAVLAYGFAPAPADDAGAGDGRSERAALIALVAGVLLSAGLFFGFKNRPGAYQGSPAALMDPARQDAAFQLDRIAVPVAAVVSPPDPGAIDRALAGHATALEELLAGYYILDRNYNYDFHNRLFLRSTPLAPDYRAAGLRRVERAGQLGAEADAAYRAVRGSVGDVDPIAALMDDVRAYAAYAIARAPVLERMSTGFEQTPAGLQHATHIYEGEGKMLGVQLRALVDKHRAVLSSAAVQSATAEFTRISNGIYDAYANRIVGF